MKTYFPQADFPEFGRSIHSDPATILNSTKQLSKKCGYLMEEYLAGLQAILPY
jgi:hypothetical protein